MSVDSAKTALQRILDWSRDRPAWQRDALRRIVSKGRLDSVDVRELTQLCKSARRDAGEVHCGAPLSAEHLPANPGKGAGVSLISISDVEGVNNLAPGQTLIFEEGGLTIIYGDNGAGKSGYARILKRACRSRNAGKIEPNIYDSSPTVGATASIAYSVGNKAGVPETWRDSERPHAVLSAVSVFDSESGLVHIEEKNEVAFRPFGLDVPDELARACQEVKIALSNERKELEQTRNSIFIKPPWSPASAVGRLLGSLAHDTDPTLIEDLATLTEDEAARLIQLREDLSSDLVKAAAIAGLRAENVMRLRETIELIQSKTDESSAAHFAALSADAITKRRAASYAADQLFSLESLPGVGGPTWRLLWEAARRYSTEMAYPKSSYPALSPDARCVLCQQNLDAAARERMQRFEEFIQQDIERQAQAAERLSKLSFEELLSTRIGTRPSKINLDELMLEDHVLASRVRRFIGSCRLRRYALVTAHKLEAPIALPAALMSPAPDLASLEEKIREHGLELGKLAETDERQKLELQLAELVDRVSLRSAMHEVLVELERLEQVKLLDEAMLDTTTNAITKMGNDLADSTVTPLLRDRFQEEIIRLAAEKVRVEIVRSGGKFGSPLYQVRLFAKPSAKVQEILSEGEKTCVALAAFLAELATAEHKSTLVFDDPVSSLDHRWRARVAARLVAETVERQVVVFTHDLVFVNDLMVLAESGKRPLRMLTVRRGTPGAGIVTEGMPWKAQRVEARIDLLEKEARAAKKLYDSDEEENYNLATAKIYGGLRASWERALEEVAFYRVVQRHRDYIDTNNLKKVSALTEADCKNFDAGFKKCCGIIDAHDPSSGRNADTPPPNEVVSDIKALKEWVADLRSRQKNID
jgi:energy-coupling factor transporter ATP-binding protein EcfA2